MLEPPSLERFYQFDDPELGVARSNISEEAARRHVARYQVVGDLLAGVVAADDEIFDIGAGSGYGTKILSDRFRYVTGIEPGYVALAYAKKHYSEVRFANWAKVEDVAVMVESLEHMTVAEARDYLSDDVRILCVTTPLVTGGNNSFHVNEFSRKEDVEGFIQRFGFKPLVCRVDYGVQFTTGDLGDQFYGLFARVEPPSGRIARRR